MIINQFKHSMNLKLKKTLLKVIKIINLKNFRKLEN